MHIELVDVLRCPNEHEESWLVASIEQMEHREIVRGLLGCPVCSAEHRIEERTVLMGGTVTSYVPQTDSRTTLKLAALLDLTEPSSFVVLAGVWAAHARSLRELLDQRFIMLNAPSAAETDVGIYGVRAPSRILPFAVGSARGIALDASHEGLAPLAARALRAGGRLIAPATTTVPPDVTELARDDELWVAERVAAPRLVGLRRS